MKPLLLQASSSEAIWAGDRIRKIRNVDSPIGAWWEVSCHPNAKSKVINMDGNPYLYDLIQDDPDSYLGKGLTLHEMLRCGYLDTSADLSIQVHPTDEYALKHSNDYGKFESWYIVDCAPGATLVAGTTIDDAEIIYKALQDGSIENYLQKWEVHPGDYIIIPTGMLHALGKDMLAFEVGTNSDTTYRFYDYDRKDKNGNKRPLHVKESFDVADFSLQPTFVKAKEQSRCIGNTPYFTVDELFIDDTKHIKTNGKYVIVTNLSSEEIQLEYKEGSLTMGAYESIFVPASLDDVTIMNRSHVLVSRTKG